MCVLICRRGIKSQYFLTISHTLQVFNIMLPHLGSLGFEIVGEGGCVRENTNKQNLIENQEYEVRLATRFAVFLQSRTSKRSVAS